MAELDTNLLMWMIFGVFVVFSGFFSVRYWLKSKIHTPEHLQTRISELQQALDWQKKESRRWQGRFGSTQAKPTIEAKAEDLENPENFDKMIDGLIAEYSHLAPKWAQGFLKPGPIRNYIIEEAKKHPEDAKRILSEFIKPPGTTQELEAQQQTGGNTGEWA